MRVNDKRRINRHIGEGVRLLRDVKRLPLAYLAEATGLSEDSLAQLERGERGAESEELRRLAEVCDVPVGFFFEGLDDAATG